MLARLQDALGHRFRRPVLLTQALTHRSATPPNNERLEFLGDALLNFAVAAALFDARPDDDEGDLSRLRAALVRETSLAEVARELGLAEALRLGGGERKSGGFRRDSILADALEALIASVYLDAGLEAALGVCRHLFTPRLQRLPAAAALKDAKTRLQEWLQARGRARPQYRVLREQGPAHRRRFQVRCEAPDGRAADAEADSRKAAEQQAAAVLLAQLEGDDA
ncbi:MAG: ribonuclease III [Gammaproteobacteria bacterium]|nr:ribonuclease III [Gammaproteobacteria bacterium]